MNQINRFRVGDKRDRKSSMIHPVQTTGEKERKKTERLQETAKPQRDAVVATGEVSEMILSC